MSEQEKWIQELEQWLRADQCDSYGESAFWETIEPARKLIGAHVPKRLFKFVRMERSKLGRDGRIEVPFHERMLREQFVGLTSAICFNDPFDTLQRIDPGLIDRILGKFDIMEALAPRYQLVHGLKTVEELFPHYTELQRKCEKETVENEGWTDERFEYYMNHPDEFRKWQADNVKLSMRAVQQWVQGMMYVSSFSERVDNMLMWSHYAVNYQCFALGYDMDDAENAEYRKYLFPVVYSDRKLDASWGVYEYMCDMNRDINYVRNHLLALKSALFKSPDWVYEKEWRLVRREPENKGKYSNMPLKAKAIYYGVRMKPDALRIMHVLAQELGLEEYRMEIDVTSESYDMKVVPMV